MNSVAELLTKIDDSPRSTSRGEYVYRALCDAIQTGQIKQGTRVREEDIAKLLGVSRTPVREALFRLQTRGLLDMAPGRGLVVVEITRQKLVELYAMRELLEGGAARMAAQHASPSEVETLQYLLGEFQKAGDNAPRLAAINRQFHAAIYDATHNRHMLTALADLTDALALLQNTTFSVPTRPKLGLKEHRAIVNAIAQKNPDQAEQAARDHIRAAHQARASMMLGQP